MKRFLEAIYNLIHTNFKKTGCERSSQPVFFLTLWLVPQDCLNFVKQIIGQ